MIIVWTSLTQVLTRCEQHYNYNSKKTNFVYKWLQSLLIAYIHNHFPEDYILTVLDNEGTNNNVNIDGKSIELDVWDIIGARGDFDNDGLRALSYPETDVFLICYDICSRQSFENVAQ